MPKVTLNEVGNLQNETSARGTINDNFDAIAEVLDNMVSRDGTLPNALLDDLDMDEHRILNLPAPVDYKEPARHGQLQQYVDEAEAARDLTLGYRDEAEGFRDDTQVIKDDAQTIQDSLHKDYQGAYATAPTLDRDGNALTNKAFYYNTVTLTFWVYDGTQWVEYEVPVGRAYDLVFYIQGLMPAGQDVFRMVVIRDFTLPQDLTNSLVVAGTAATAAYTLVLKKNGSSIGTVDWGATDTDATITFASAVSFTAGDILTVSTDATPDDTLADVAMTLAATR